MKTFTAQKMGITAALLVAIAAFFVLSHKAPASPAPSTAPALGDGQSVTALSPEAKKYTDALTGFSFTYPASFTISSFGSVYDSSGETVLLQGAGGEKGLQVLVTPFDESAELTAARIHHDIPDLAMADVTTRALGTGVRMAQAVVFTSSNSFMGESREAWFLFEKRLYQVSAPLAAQDALTAVLASWQF